MKTRSYFVWIKDEDNVIVKVKDDVNRPNNPDCDDVLRKWIRENYGFIDYSYFELDTLDVINI